MLGSVYVPVMTAPETGTIEIESVETTVQAGETLGVAVGVEGRGEDGPAEEVDATLVVEGRTVDDATLDPDGSATADLEWTAPPEAVGTVDVTVQVGDHSTTESVTVADAPASFAVSIDAVDEFVSPGGRVTLDATVENRGTLEGTQTVEFLIDGESRETRLYSLDGQGHESATVSHEVCDDDGPELTLTVTTEGDAAETTVEVIDRTVTPARTPRSKGGMGAVGWLLCLGMVVLLFPLVPFVAVLKLVAVVRERQPFT